MKAVTECWKSILLTLTTEKSQIKTCSEDKMNYLRHEKKGKNSHIAHEIQ